MLVNKTGWLLGGSVSKYGEMSDVGARGFVFDALVGIAAWWATQRQRQRLTRRPLRLWPWLHNRSRPEGSPLAVADWLGLVRHPLQIHSLRLEVSARCWCLRAQGCVSFLFTSLLDVAYGFGWESFGGPWLYFSSMNWCVRLKGGPGKLLCARLPKA